MNYVLKSIILGLFVVGITSCDNNDEAPATTGQVNFTMKGTYDEGSSSGRVMNNLGISSATAAVTSVELEADEFESEQDSTDSEEGETEIEFEGQYTVDLLTGTSDPAFGLAVVDAQNYNEIEIDFGTFLPGGSSIIVEGTYLDNNNEPIPFKVSLNKAIELEIESNNALNIEAGSVEEIVATIDFVTLFQNIDFALAQPNADGLVVVDATVNTYVYNLISENISASVEIEIENDDE